MSRFLSRKKDGPQSASSMRPVKVSKGLVQTLPTARRRSDRWLFGTELFTSAAVLVIGFFLHLDLFVHLPLVVLGVAAVFFTHWLWPLIKVRRLREPLNHMTVGLRGETFARVLEFLHHNLDRMASIRDDVDRLEGAAQNAARSTMLGFARRDIGMLGDQIHGVLSKEGYEFDKEDVDSFISLCFAHADRGYRGTNNRVPSVFLELYGEYLDHHKRFLNKPTVTSKGPRIITAAGSALLEDSEGKATNGAYQNFVTWHKSNGVPLLRVEPHVAALVRRTFGIERDADVGLWDGHYALRFVPNQDLKKIRVNMVFPGQADYDVVVKYLNQLEEKAIVLEEKVSLFGAELVEAWEDYVDPEQSSAVLHKFLHSIIEPYMNAPKPPAVLDAAAGTGHESIFLRDLRVNVTSNEIERGLLEKARRNARRRGHNLLYTEVRWQGFHEFFNESMFDVVLVLGNSLCFVRDKNDRKKCMENFYRVLRPGGTLVVDECNFPYILENAEAIRSDPWANFRYSAKVMYCGNLVQARPWELIGSKLVRFAYFKADNVHSSEDIERNIVGVLDVYPFEKGEIQKLLETAGFRDITFYSDLKPGFDPNADFFTYVAKKGAT